MAVNVATLPQLPGGALFVLETNSDFVDAIGFVTVANGSTPIDLTGVTFRAQFRQSVQSTSVLLEASTTNGLIVLDAPNGRIGFNVPAASMAAAFEPLINPTSTGMITVSGEIVASSGGTQKSLSETNGPFTAQIKKGFVR